MEVKQKCIVLSVVHRMRMVVNSAISVVQKLVNPHQQAMMLSKFTSLKHNEEL
jgi:hypothetical protein